MHQMGLTQSDTAIEEERIEGDGPAFGDALGGGMGQFVGLADNECVEGKAIIQRCRGHQPIVLGGRWWCGGFARCAGFYP